MARTMTAKQYREAREAAAKAKAEADANRKPNPIWDLPDEQGVEIIIQFLDEPIDEFQFYRATRASTFKHVSGEWESGPYVGRDRAEIPFGLQRIPIEDYTPPFTDDNNSARTRYNSSSSGSTVDYVDIAGVRMDLISEVLNGADLYPYNRDDNGFPRVESKFMGNVVVHSWPATTNKRGKPRRVPEVGSIVLLAIRKPDYDKIVEELKRRHAKEHADVMGTCWGIEVRKVKADGGRTTRYVDVTPYPDIPPVSVPFTDLWDAGDARDSLREQLLSVASTAYSDMLGEHPLWTPGDEPEHEASSGLDEFTPEVTFEDKSNAALSAMLKAKKVTVPTRGRRTPDEYRSELLDLAADHLR